MMRSLYSAISGLGVNQQAMDVLGNNVANVSTVGFKAGRTVFQDMFSQTISAGTSATSTSGSTNPKQIGLGSAIATVANMFTSGTMQTTDVNTDLAVQGDGFFVLRGNSTNEFLYTRAGDFSFDSAGRLVSTGGYVVQGWMADTETGEIAADTTTEDIIIDSDYQAVEAKATTEVAVTGVLSTDADPSVLEFSALMHYADASNSIFEVYSTDGVLMDVADDEGVTVKSHGTDITNMKYLYNDADVNLNVDTSNTLLVYINNTAYTFIYGTGADTATTKYFTTLGDLSSKLQTKLDELTVAGDFTVDVTNGTISVARTADASGTDISIDSFSGSSRLAVLLGELTGTYDDIGDAKNSDEFFYESTIYAGRDFTTLTELASEIEAVIDGNVLASTDFDVAFDDATGKFVYTNSSVSTSAGGTGLIMSGFSFDKAYSGTDFESNMASGGTLTLGLADAATPTNIGYSEKFLRTAKDADALNELFTSAGDSLGLDATAVIQFGASIGGATVSGTGSIPVLEVADNPATPLIDETTYSTLQDLRIAIAEYLGYSTATESALSDHVGSFDENAGKLVLTSNDGEPNELDYLTFDIIGSSNYDTFYDYYDYTVTQEAEGGTVTTSQTIYDAQGNQHTVKYTYELVDSNENLWKMSISTPDDNATVAFNGASGDSVYLHFNANGSFNYISTEGGARITDLTYSFQPNNGAGVISDVAVDLGSASKFDGLYLASGTGGIEQTTQDGYPTGSLDEIMFNEAGEVIGYYTNGEVAVLAQIALATFTNVSGLLKVGDTTFMSTTSSGEAAVGAAGTGSRGDIASGVLENSNVDLSSEFVNMITTQRGFQANSRVITTSDEMLQELLSLKR